MLWLLSDGGGKLFERRECKERRIKDGAIEGGSKRDTGGWSFGVLGGRRGEGSTNAVGNSILSAWYGDGGQGEKRKEEERNRVLTFP